VAQLPSPVTVRHGYRYGRMTGVISSQGMVFRVPVDYTRSRPSRRWSELRVGGPHGSPPCLRVPRAPRARR
jgi:hypothetical protein